MERPELRLDGFDPELARRVRLTVSCTDCDDVPKVDGAGEIRDHDGQRVQVMHNGLLVVEGGYFGDWTTEIIRVLRGHHEPQEELVFHRIVERLKADSESPTMIEFGSFWMYYGLWFCKELAGARALGLEPDPAYLEVGRRNADLNGLTDRVRFIQGGVGSEPGQAFTFTAQSDDQDYQVPQHDIASLMAEGGFGRVDLVLADIQGAESILLEQSRRDLETGRVRFLVVSTHHASFSGDPLTHQKALKLLQDMGAHIIAEHSVSESFSGDGLIAASFDPRDKDLTVPISYARSKDSLFGELEPELADAIEWRRKADEATAGAMRHAEGLERRVEHVRSERDAAQSARDQALAERNAAAGERAAAVAARDEAACERDALAAELAAVTSSRTWRWSQAPRDVYARLRNR